MELIKTLADTTALAISLSADAFAAAAARASSREKNEQKKSALALALSAALVFGAFQAGMPFLGWLIGSIFARAASYLAPVASFAILAAIGSGMIYDSVSGKEGSIKASLLATGLATSIDALSVGCGIGLGSLPIALVCPVVGAVTFVLSLAGGMLGEAIGKRYGRIASFAGGAMLCGMAARSLAEFIIKIF